MHVTPQRVNEIEPSTYDIIVNIIPGSFKFALLYVLAVVPVVINSVYMGHVASKNQLAAVGLGNMMMNIFVLFTIDGLASGIDILSSQAYGAKENRLACITYQRARMVTALQCLWIVPMFCFTERWMTAIGQDPIVSKFAGEYTRAAAPFVIIFTEGTCMCKLYLAFLRPGKLMALSIILTPLHAVWVHIFVGVCSLGNAGLGLAFGTGSIVWYIAIACLLWKDAPELGVQRHWIFWFEKESFSGWCAYLKVAAPCMCQTTLEALYYEIVSLLAGYLGPTSLAATSITFTCLWLPLALPYGLAVGTTILIGNAIGSGSVAMVKKNGSAVSLVGSGLLGSDRPNDLRFLRPPSSSPHCSCGYPTHVQSVSLDFQCIRLFRFVSAGYGRNLERLGTCQHTCVYLRDYVLLGHATKCHLTCL